jgi:hypothetical protein
VSSAPQDQTGPWGEELFPQKPDPGFAAAGLLIPRIGRGGVEETFSPAVSIRYSAVAGKAPRLTRPSKDPNVVLQQLGLVSTRYPQRLADMKTTRNGVFAPFESLGISAVFFRDEQHRQRALQELDDEFEFVPDFPLSLPLRITATEYPSNSRLTPRTAREWPDESGVAEAHAGGILGANVLVAVLDTGVDADHTEFAGRRINFRYISQFPNSPNWPPRDVRGFDTNGHGTHVCGILAGRSVGVAPEAELYVATVIESEATLTSATRVVAGLQWVLRQFTRPDNERKPAVLSMSLGFPPDPPGLDGPSLKLRYETMQLLIRSLRQANVLPVMAIGNSGADQYGYPAALDEVVAVGAVGFDGKLAPFSGSTPKGVKPAKPDVVGYGVGVDSALERDYDNTSIYKRMSGTSMATPYVAGIAALYRSEDPALSVDEVEKTLYAHTQAVSGPKHHVGQGLASYVR